MIDGMADRRSLKSKGLEFGNLLTTLGLLAAMATGYADFSSRMAVLENNQAVLTNQLAQLLASQQSTDARQNAEIAEIRRDTRDAYREINQQLTTLIASRSATHGR